MHHVRRAVLAAALVLSALPAPAFAITNGASDGSAHPAVGLLVSGPAATPVCSGTLVAPTVFLTAGHCVAGRENARYAVQFDTGVVQAMAAVVEPGYGKDAADFRDLAVVVLGRAPAGITPALLASAGLADRVAAGTSLTAVGYGYYDRVTGAGPPRFLYDGVRRQATAPLSSVHKASLHLLSNTQATGQGGVCFGDSGGPWLLGGAIVAVTSGGDTACSGMDSAYRVDTPAAREFLAGFVALP